jgi:hypothetical protein
MQDVDTSAALTRPGVGHMGIYIAAFLNAVQVS